MTYKYLYISLKMKRLEWLGNSYDCLKAFLPEARHQAGYELYLVQKGLHPNDWKSISRVGAGAIEIRIHLPFEHRVIYVAKYPDAVFVLHSFAKKNSANAI